MADYTDIDKLREQGQTSAYMDPDAAFDEAHEAARIEDALATAQRWEGRANALDKALSAAVAELVGLRTEVDQLRTDNEKWLAVADDKLRLANEAATANVASLRAECDALQAKLDGADQAFAAAVELGQELTDQVDALQVQVAAAQKINASLAEQSARDCNALLRKDQQIRALEGRAALPPNGAQP